MPWAWVQGAQGHTVTSGLTVSFSAPTQAGNLIVARFSQFNVSPGGSGLSDANNQPLTRGPGLASAGAGPACTEIYWIVSATTRMQAITVAPCAYIGILIDEFSPPAGTVAAGGTATASGTGTAAATGSFAPGTNDLVIAAIGNGSPVTSYTPVSGYTRSQFLDAVSSVNIGIAGLHKLQGGASENPGATLGASQGWIAVAMGFSPGGGGAAGPIPVLISDGCVPAPLRRHGFRHIHL